MIDNEKIDSSSMNLKGCLRSCEFVYFQTVRNSIKCFKSDEVCTSLLIQVREENM